MNTPPNPTQSIVDQFGKMTTIFRTWTQIVTKQQILVGTGTPETFVAAEQTALYMDDAGTAGNILYIKKSADIGGDRTKGWILV